MGFEHEERSRSVWAAGIGVGLAAGGAMVLLSMLVARWRGFETWLPLKLHAALLLGPEALRMDSMSIELGMIIQITLCVALSVVFAAISQRPMATLSAMAAGTVFGAAVFGMVAYVVLPVINPFLFTHINNEWLMLYFVVFGATLGLIVPLRSYLGVTYRMQLQQQRA